MAKSKKGSKKKSRRDDDDDDFPDTWDPEKGETLTGTITEIRDATTEYGDTQVAEIEDEDGEKFTVWSTAVLKKKLFKVYDEGDEVSITFLGKKKKGKFKSKQYKVVDAADANDDDDDDDDD